MKEPFFELILARRSRVNPVMNDVTKGVVGLVLWLLAGFAVTEVAAFTLSDGDRKRPATPSGYAPPNQTVAVA
jgi:hypothetical protein